MYIMESSYTGETVLYELWLLHGWRGVVFPSMLPVAATAKKYWKICEFSQCLTAVFLQKNNVVIDMLPIFNAAYWHLLSISPRRLFFLLQKSRSTHLGPSLEFYDLFPVFLAGSFYPTEIDSN